MANEPVGVEILERDILERAGIERRDDLPICIEATWGQNADGTPRVFAAGEPHPLLPGHLIFAIFQNPSEILVYSLCPQGNGAASPKNAEEVRKQMRENPARTTLVKTARTSVIEIMVLDVFAESIAQELRVLDLDTYGEEDPETPKKEEPEPQPVNSPAGT